MSQCKCIDCGFLAYRRTISLEFSSISDLAEVERGEDGISILSSPPNHPICFVRAFNLQSEYKLEPLDNETEQQFKSRFFYQSGIDSQKLLQSVNKPRECEHFVKWQQGFTPKEHQEILDREWQLEQEKKRKKSDRTWHFIELAITLVVGAIIALIAAYIGKGH